MWSGDRDTNELGEAVLLLQPVDNNHEGNKRGRKNKSKGSTKPSSSYIGGIPRYHERDVLLTDSAGGNHSRSNPKCTRCGKPMYLLIQLHAPLDAVDRTLYVFGCNDASCHTRKSDTVGDSSSNSRFRSCIGSGAQGGALRCIRSQQKWKDDNSKVEANKPGPIDSLKPKVTLNDNLENNDWGMDDGSDDWGDGDDDWGCSEASGAKADADVSMDDLETMLTNCEMRSTSKSGSGSSTKVRPASDSVGQSHIANSNPSDHPLANNLANNFASPSFEQHDLEMIDEPPTGSGRDNNDSDEDEDDEIGGDSSKVDSMLSRYLDKEDDEEILSALTGGAKYNACNSNNTKGGSGGGEKYERLPPEERAFLAFTKRLKRAPGQVARYAYAGSPLWSVPLLRGNSAQTKHPKQRKSKKSASKSHSLLPTIPTCSCGADRMFEFQVLPSLLHVLDVDVHASGGKNDDVMNLISSGGMNWGALAVYSCSESCDKSREEFIIVQDAVCDAPIEKKAKKNDDSDDDNDHNMGDR
ncbi:hypothetical protein ACHAWF_015962 [Thalassiosira exigua]